MLCCFSFGLVPGLDLNCVIFNPWSITVTVKNIYAYAIEIDYMQIFTSIYVYIILNNDVLYIPSFKNFIYLFSFLKNKPNRVPG